MPLIADRFVMDAEQRAVDLATGDRVLLKIVAAGGHDELRRWALRCDTLQKLHHPAIARLIDYGAVGQTQRFEAWGCDTSWHGHTAEAEETCARASRVLRACGLSTGPSSLKVARASVVGPVAVPDGDVGFPCIREAFDEHDLPIDAHAIVALERRAVAALGELFESTESVRPRIAALWGPDGAGKHTAAVDLARMARLRGFVPVSAHLFPAVARLVSGRSLCVIDADGMGAGWIVLVQAAVQTPRPHVLLFIGREEMPGVDGIRLDPLSSEALVGAVCPSAADVWTGRVQRAATQSEGWPGRFARLLWREAPFVEVSSRRLLRAAEQSAVYGAEQSRAAETAPPDAVWPEAGELVALRRRLECAVRLAESGRHAPGERALRRTIGGLSRREAWAPAGEGSLALADLLMRRGRVGDAHVTLQRAADCWRRAGEPARLVDVAAKSGTVLTELARLQDAETVLSAALATARSAHDGQRAARVAEELARVLFWRGRYDEADEALRPTGPHRVNLPHTAPTGLAARIAVGQRVYELAVSRAREAEESARRVGVPRLMADAAYGAALAHLAVGDVAAVERDSAACVAAARAAHEPLWAARSRLVLVEAFRRSGRRAAAAALLDRIGKAGSMALPPIVQARWALLREAMSTTGSTSELVARHVASTGLEALALFVRPTERQPAGHGLDAMLDDVVDILTLCQTSEDETGILLEVCRRVRVRIHAAAVAIAVDEGSGWHLVASDGARVDLSVAERAAAAGMAVMPHRHADRLEAAAPVRYGGTTVGVVVARWTVGTTHDLSQATALLTTAAAASAPILAAVIARRRQPPAAGLMELRGTSAAMADVRRAIERAAAAPFAVLVEGESGSGKELVARALHRAGPRRDRAFCALNCAALPDDLVESELFGHARGAFTGAVGERPGVFEDAQGGTLFLDEIGELSPRAQAKMLRVLQDGEIRRIGENVARRIDVRVVSATNRDLRTEAAASRFRIDLLYRLDVIRITVPPMRERREDVCVLAEHFWREMAARVGSRATLGAATLAALARYDWPGNVRELQNVLASLLVRSPKRGVVPPTALGPQFGEQRFAEASRLDEARRTFEDRFVRAALARTGGHRARAAEELGVTRQGLTKLMTRLGIKE